MIQRPLYLEKIRPFMNTDVVKVLTGIRRCGKSVMLELIQQELVQNGIAPSQIIAINFESQALPFPRDIQGAYTFIKAAVAKAAVTATATNGEATRSGRKIYLFLDEIQELEGWERLVNSCMIDFDADIYITGSNAKMLSGELATYLGGRYVEIKVYPFSFREVLDMLSAGGSQRSEAEAFRRYLIFGGMPFLYRYAFDDAAALQYLGDLFDSIILKDIAQRNHIRDIDQLKRLILYLVATTGNIFSARSVMDYFKHEKRSISTETIYNYIEYCKEACLIHMVPREDLVGKRLLSTQEKIYLVDHGIREALYGNNQRDINQTLENIVFMELVRRGYEVTIGKQRSLEVDFCARKGGTKVYLQVAYLLADDATVEREFSALETIPDNYPKFVITMDEIDRSHNGIQHRNIRRFLLEAL